MDLYSYSEFRLYIRDRIEALRAENEHLSIREILRRLECSSPSYYKEVILDAKKKMSLPTARRFAVFFNLTTDETDYFLLLVQHNQATNEIDRLHFHEKLLQCKRQPATENHVLNIKEYGYLVDWQPIVIREVLPLFPDFGNRNDDERKQLSHLLRVKLTTVQIDAAVQLLENLKFIRKNSAGNYIKTETAIRVDKKSPVAYTTLSQFMEFGKTIIPSTDVAERLAKLAILSMNSEIYSIIEKKINEAFQEIVAITGSTDVKRDRLYAMNIQFFPLTRLPEEQLHGGEESRNK